MSFNLAQRSAEDRNRIELDKQAAFVVWKLKQGKSGPEEILRQTEALRTAEEQAWFQQAIEKYKRTMGLT
jgi:hypothetical protein